MFDSGAPERASVGSISARAVMREPEHCDFTNCCCCYDLGASLSDQIRFESRNVGTMTESSNRIRKDSGRIPVINQALFNRPFAYALCP